MTDTTYRYLQKHKAQACVGRTVTHPDHRVSAHMDYRKMFSSRPGSADWYAICICGWRPKTYYYGESEAMAAGGRHLMKVTGMKQADADALLLQ